MDAAKRTALRIASDTAATAILPTSVTGAATRRVVRAKATSPSWRVCDGRTAMAFRYRFTLPDGEVIHVRTGRKYAHTMNGMRKK